MLKNKTMICRRSLFLCCVLNFCLMPAETAKQQKHLLSQAFWINMTMCVIYISIEFVMKPYSWELDVLISGLWNEQMHAVLITMKCVSFVCKCVNVSVSFLIIFLCTSPLTFKKKCSTEKKINKQGERALFYEWKWSLCLDTQKMQCRYCELGTL